MDLPIQAIMTDTEWWQQCWALRRKEVQAYKDAFLSLKIPPPLDGIPLPMTFVMYIPERANAAEDTGTSSSTDAT